MSSGHPLVVGALPRGHRAENCRDFHAMLLPGHEIVGGDAFQASVDAYRFRGDAWAVGKCLKGMGLRSRIHGGLVGRHVYGNECELPRV